MKINIILLTLFFSSFSLDAQIKNIEYPKFESQITLPKNKNFHNFYITDKQEIFLNNQILNYWDQVGSSILEIERTSLDKDYSGIIINADINVPFNLMERLRKEVLKVWNGLIYYRTISDTSSSVILIETYGPHLKEHLVLNKGAVKVISGEEIIKKDVRLGDFSPPIPLPPISDTEHWANILYGLNVQSVKDLLQSNWFKYDAIEIVNDREYHWQGKSYTFEKDAKHLNELIENAQHVIFVKANQGITYGDYLQGIHEISRNRRQSNEKLHIDNRVPHLIEIDEILEKELMNQGINIF